MGLRRAVLGVIAVGSMGCAAPAVAHEKSRYTLWNPTPDSKLRDMSTDRPDRTESAYTVDAGRLQIEMDVLVFTYDARSGAQTRSLDVFPFNVKLGLTNSTDLQIAHGAYSRARTSQRAGDDGESGFGDLSVRLKHNVWGNDGGRTALAIMPFVKLPTNTLDALNDHVEGGVIVPFAIDIGSGLGLGLMTEIDVVRAEDGRGYEPVFVNSAALGFDLTDRWGAYIEAFVEYNAQSGEEPGVTLSGGLTFAVDDNLQLDAGANIGASGGADDLNLFVGLSRRY